MQVEICKTCGKIAEYNAIWGQWFHEVEPANGHKPVIENCESKDHK